MGKIARTTQEYFDEVAKEREGRYDLSNTGFSKLAGLTQQNILKLVLKEMKSRKPRLVLEAGCGPGRYVSAYLGVKDLVVFVDFSLGMLKIARRHTTVASEHSSFEFINADLRYLPFRDRVYDVILCVDTLHHLNSGEQKRAIAELACVLSPLGCAIIEIKNSLFPLYLLGISTRRNNAGMSTATNPIAMGKYLASLSLFQDRSVGVWPWGVGPLLLCNSCLMVYRKNGRKL